MTEQQRAEFFAMRKALDRYVDKIVENPVEINENTAAIRPWMPGPYEAEKPEKRAAVCVYDGIPYKCIQPHDSTGNPAWNPADAHSLWMQYHGTSKATARPWVMPTGAHDVYRAGEWMIWTDGLAYQCIADTVYSPADYPQAWGAGESIA